MTERRQERFSMGNDAQALATSERFKDRNRRVPKQERSIESVAKVIHGAECALEKFGYSKLTMRNVAAMASVSVGTIYDYFPSKHAMLHRLLKNRLELRLNIFDEVYSGADTNLSLPFYMDRYLQRSHEEGLRSSFDMELQRAAEDDEEMQQLLKWHHDETVKRYVSALQAAGSTWPEDDLAAVSAYLIAILEIFEPSAESVKDPQAQKRTSWMLRRTILTLVKDVLATPPHEW